LTTLVKGLPVLDAMVQLDRSGKMPSLQVKKLMASALANAENNFGLDRKNLYVFEMRVDEGPTMKRWMPRAFGRATEIHKRTSRITIVLEEFVEGAGRRTKAEMAAEKKKRKNEEKKNKTEKKTVSSKKTESKVTEKKGKKSGGFSQKMFQRKSA
jgi:large subunit ribosomal protein L22